MRILNSYQNNQYRNNYFTTSFKSAKARVSIEELGTLPLEVREAITKAANDQGVKIPTGFTATSQLETRKLSSEQVQTAAKLVKGIQNSINSAQKKLDELCQMLEGAGLVVEKPAKTGLAKKAEPTAEEILEQTLHGKSRKCKNFHLILDSTDCKREQVLEIIKNINEKSVKEPKHRVELYAKIIGFASKNKDNDILHKLYLDKFHAYNKDENISTDDKRNLMIKMFDVATNINDEDIVKGIYNDAGNHNGYYDSGYSEFYIYINKKAVNFAATAKDENFVHDVIYRNSYFNKTLKISPEKMKKVVENYIAIILEKGKKEPGNLRKSPEQMCNWILNCYNREEENTLRQIIREIAMEKYGVKLKEVEAL